MVKLVRVYPHAHNKTAKETHTRLENQSRGNIFGSENLCHPNGQLGIAGGLSCLNLFGLRDEFRRRQTEIILVFFAHSVGVYGARVPANSDPTITPELTDHGTFTGSRTILHSGGEKHSKMQYLPPPVIP